MASVAASVAKLTQPSSQTGLGSDRQTRTRIESLLCVIGSSASRRASSRLPSAPYN